MSHQQSTAATPTDSTAGQSAQSQLLIRNVGEVQGKPMAMDGVKGVTMRLLVGRDDGAPNFAMRHFTVEPGGHSPRHQHNYEHEVLVLRGAGRIEYDGRFEQIGPGDALLVEPNIVHQFKNVGDQPFEFICLVPVTHDCGQRTPGS